MANLNYPDFVKEWSKRFSCDEHITKLGGGCNSSVYLCEGERLAIVVKKYSCQNNKYHNRMLAELEFLSLCSEIKTDYVPRILEVDYDNECLILEAISGVSFNGKDEVSRTDIFAAVSFLQLVNLDRDIAEHFIKQMASDFSPTIRGHIKNIDVRLETLEWRDVPIRYRTRARLAYDLLRKCLDRYILAVEKAISLNLVEDEADSRTYIVSPSDFGFHNAIRNNGKIVFIDFEYAGWDDPAKTCLDFMYQPGISAKSYRLALLSAINRRYRKDVYRRCCWLEEATRLKWLCIVLSVLDARRLEAISELRSVSIDDVLEERLITAEVMASRGFLKWRA